VEKLKSVVVGFSEDPQKNLKPPLLPEKAAKRS